MDWLGFVVKASKALSSSTTALLRLKALRDYALCAAAYARNRTYPEKMQACRIKRHCGRGFYDKTKPVHVIPFPVEKRYAVTTNQKNCPGTALDV